MPRRRKIVWLGSILLVLAGGIGGYYWYWLSNALDRKVCQLVYEAADYPDSRTEKFFREWNLDFLLKGKPKPREKNVLLFAWPAPREYSFAEDDLLATGNAATSALVSLLDDENCQVRYIAAEFLGYVGDARAVGPLIQALQRDKNEIVRMRAVIALGKLGDPRAAEPLRRSSQNDQNQIVRDVSEYVLGRLGNLKAIGALQQELRIGCDLETLEKCKRAITKLNCASAAETATAPGKLLDDPPKQI
ncbi:MAG: HEAT repeat domain-containing protein [Planctomycetes bacterium]|nr:HEAT repeat domain-containing protein [Planctomycetota bacterium]